MRPFLRYASRLAAVLALASGGWAQAGLTFVTIDVPGATDTSASGINGLGQIVGAYTDSGGVQHGFVTTIPEPSTLILASIGAVVLVSFASLQERR